MTTNDKASTQRHTGVLALGRALVSWRTAAVTSLSFSSGMPLGLVWISLPDFMREAGYDIRIIGLTTLAHAPWTFKVLWAPLMDRYAPRWLGRRRGWIAITQIVLSASTLLLAGIGDQTEAPWIILSVTLAIAVASASQDIVVDAYAVEVLQRDEQAIAVGARIASYRAAMFVVGALSISLTAMFSWRLVCVGTALLYAPLLVVTLLAPHPAHATPTPRTVRDSLWLPFVGFLSRHRAPEILAFVLLYKLSDQLSQSLLRPFLGDMGYTAIDRGIVLGTVGLWGTVVGTFLGGATTSMLGLGRSLWIFGILQIASNLGYILVSVSEVNRPLMYGAMAFETLTTGTGMGAFGVLLLRLTQKRFSATQYALFSSLFALPRIVAGPITGSIVHAAGWTNFFWFTMVAGVPGLVMLARFVPWSSRDVVFTVEPRSRRRRIPTWSVAMRSLTAGGLAFVLAVVVTATLGALEASRGDPTTGFDLIRALFLAASPEGWSGLLTWVGWLSFGSACALVTAALIAVKDGAAERYQVSPTDE